MDKSKRTKYQREWKEKRKAVGWVACNFFIPKEIADKLKSLKRDLMKEFFFKQRGY